MFNAAGGGYDAAFWELPYNKILGCNIVLDCLDDMTGEESLRGKFAGRGFRIAVVVLSDDGEYVWNALQ